MDDNQAYVIKSLNSSSIYLDEFLCIDRPNFEQMLGQICPTDIQLSNANPFDTVTPFLELELSITNGIVSSKIYDIGMVFILK